MDPDNNTYSNNTTDDIFDEQNQSSSFYMEDNNPAEEEVVIQNTRPSPYEEEKYQAEAQRNKSVQTNKKIAKSAVEAIATAYAGPGAGKLVSAINDSGLADQNYERIASTIEKQSRINPAMRKLQNKLNEADEDGVVDAADSAVRALGGSVPGAEGDPAKSGASMPNDSTPTKASDATSNNANKPTVVNTKDSNAKKEKKAHASGDSSLLNSIKEHPQIVVIILIAGGGFLLFILFMSLFLGGGAAEESSSFLDSEYDFTNTKVILTNSYTNESDKVVLQEMMLEDLIKGATYAEMYNNVGALSQKGKENLFKAFMVVANSIALSAGGYNSNTKEIEIKSGANGLPYCDIVNGCKVISSGGANTYVTASYSGSFTGATVAEIPEAPSDVVSALNSAYNEVKYLLLTPNDVNEAITSYTYGTPPYTQSIKEGWIKSANGASSYKDLITSAGIYNNYKIYNIEDYAEEYNYSNNTAYWWPIGSKSPNSSGIYRGTPTATYITSPFGWRTGTYAGYHTGIDIGASCNSNIIATRDGTVKKSQYNKSCGNFILIDHGDGTQSKYCHIIEGGLLVKVGETVRQGQLIAKVGTTGNSSGCHLHFEIQKNGVAVAPLEYVSASTPRPAATISSTTTAVKGDSNMQSVCLTLKKSGFSDAAVAGIMTNMHHESAFRLTALGDSGTSYGLCQWHNGRYTRLRNYCGAKLNTVECQLDYFINELQSSYKGVYTYLRANNSAWNMTNYFCINFEVPANRYVTCANRANRYANSYYQYVQNGCK